MISRWPWPAISVTDLPVTDISGYQGMAVEVYKPIHAISFAAVKQPNTLMRIYVSPVFTLR